MMRDFLGILRGALSDWLYDPRHATAPYEVQAAHADAIEAALAECKREGLGAVADDLSHGPGWEDTAAAWAWRLPALPPSWEGALWLPYDSWWLEKSNEIMKGVLFTDKNFEAKTFEQTEGRPRLSSGIMYYDIHYFESINGMVRLEIDIETEILPAKPPQKRRSKRLYTPYWKISQIVDFGFSNVKSPKGLSFVDKSRPTKVAP